MSWEFDGSYSKSLTYRTVNFLVAYTFDIDPSVRDQIRALPADALSALVAAFEVLALVPERGQPLNPANPDGALRQWVFGEARA